jgi:hypothetical protein
MNADEPKTAIDAGTTMSGAVKTNWALNSAMIAFAALIASVADIWLTNSLTKTTLIATNRAWLAPTSAEFFEQLGPYSRVQIILKNEGKTPSVDIRQIDETPVALEFVRTPSDTPYIDSFTPKWPTTPLCPPRMKGSQKAFYRWNAEPVAPLYPSQVATYTRHVPQAAFDALTTDRNHLLVIRGCFVYRDEFGEKLSPYCFYSVPPVSGPVDFKQQKFARCPRGAEDPT